jgi:TPR repeat protein
VRETRSQSPRLTLHRPRQESLRCSSTGPCRDAARPGDPCQLSTRAGMHDDAARLVSQVRNNALAPSSGSLTTVATSLQSGKKALAAKAVDELLSKLESHLSTAVRTILPCLSFCVHFSFFFLVSVSSDLSLPVSPSSSALLPHGLSDVLLQTLSLALKKADLSASGVAALAGELRSMRLLGTSTQSSLGSFPALGSTVNVDDAEKMLMDGYRFSFGLGVGQSHEQALQRFLRAAQAGHAEACLMVAAYHEQGLGTAMNVNEAIRWYKTAAELGNVDALCALGRLYESGQNGVAPNVDDAVEYYTRAAEHNNAESLTSLGALILHGCALFPHHFSHDSVAGLLYEVGYGSQAPSPDKAIVLYERAAAQGYARAENCLGSLFYRGHGVEQNYDIATDYFQRGAKKSHAASLNNLGICYEEGHGVPRDPAAAKDCYRKAAEQGYPSAENNLGFLLLMEGAAEEAESLFRLAAARGNLDALCNLGMMYEQGLADGGVNDVTAFKLYEKAARQNYVRAQVRVAVMYCEGRGIGPSLRDAAYWFEQAARQSDEQALLNLGEMYEDGLGVAANLQLAVESYQQAANLGSAEAMYRLAVMHEQGRGVPLDVHQALSLYQQARAAKHGAEPIRCSAADAHAVAGIKIAASARC